MKSSTVKLLLKSLGDKRRDTFLAVIKQQAQGDLLAGICIYFQEFAEADEEKTRHRFNLSSRQYFQHLATIGNQLQLFWAAQSETSQIGQLYELARMFVTAMEADAAADILRMGIKAAGQVEDFGMVLRFWRLANMFSAPPTIEGMTEAEAMAARDNLSAYENLMARFQVAKQIEGLKERYAVMEEILNHELLSSVDQALSKRAQYYFWKLSSYWYYLSQHQRALEYQPFLVEFIKVNDWIFEDSEASFIKELCLLAILRYQTGQIEAFRTLEHEILAFNLKSKMAEQEHILILYPFRVYRGIDNGDAKAVLAATSEFLSFLPTHQFSARFTTENLYGCLYGAIAMNALELRKRVLRMIRDFPKADFRSPYYSMVKLLEIVIALEEQDWEEAKRLIKNRKNSKDLEKGMREILSFLSFLISTWEAPGPSKHFTLSQNAADTLESLATNTRLFDYFDLPLWFEAKARNCSMLEVIQHRASEHAAD